MEIAQATGLILESRPYQEGNFIVSLFSPDRGMIRLFAPRKKRMHALPTALTQVECIYAHKDNDTLFRLRELTIADPLLGLRGSFQALQLAGMLAQTILKTQLLWKPAPKLYQLLIAYLRHAPKTANSEGFISSFLLKLLWHEGILELTTTCTHCNMPLEQAAIAPGETLCSAHAPEWSITFTHKELICLHELTFVKSLRQIEGCQVEKELSKKIKLLFDQLADC